jgi:hypothetical protein
MAFTTQANVEKFIGSTIPSGDTTYLTTLIVAADKYIEMITGRKFIYDSVASYKYYDGDRQREIMIDNCKDISEVSLLDEYGDVSETVLEDDYHTYPLNETNKFSVYLKFRRAPQSKRTVRIKAKWGSFDTAPEDIVYAATALVGNMYLAQQDKGIKSERLGAYSVTFGEVSQKDTTINTILSYYKNPEMII